MKTKDFPEIVTLCGSTRFKKEFLEIQKKLSEEGKIVISVVLFNHYDNEQISEEQKKLFDELHLRKIDISNSIFVINPNNYIGESTKKEIEYAEKNGKKIEYYSR